MNSRVLVTGGSGFIGTHLTRALTMDGIQYLNIDIVEPKEKILVPNWQKCNILDLPRMEKIINEYRPSHVVHLAARTTMSGKLIDDFCDNTLGTENVLRAIKTTQSVIRVIITSSQHVRKPGSGFPKDDEDYMPHGLYGESKVITENLTREANLNCDWVIIRPTTIWGPYHPNLPHGLWRYMNKGFYVHPKDDPVIRSYGYVKNVIWQIEKILFDSSEKVGKKIFYVGDKCVKQIDWIDAFYLAIREKKCPKIEKKWIQILAFIGDIVGKAGINFPMNSNRYFNLTTTNPINLEPIYNLCGSPPYSLQEGIEETVCWLDNEWRERA